MVCDGDRAGVGLRSCIPFYLPGQSEREGGSYGRVGNCIVPSWIWIFDVIFSGSAMDFFWINNVVFS